MNWIKTSERKPDEYEIVLVPGGIAQYRRGMFFTGMESPQYMRPINWEVTHWIPISELRPPQ